MDLKDIGPRPRSIHFHDRTEGERLLACIGALVVIEWDGLPEAFRKICFEEMDSIEGLSFPIPKHAVRDLNDLLDLQNMLRGFR